MGYLLNYWVAGKHSIFHELKKLFMTRCKSIKVFAHLKPFYVLSVLLMTACFTVSAQTALSTANSSGELEQDVFAELDKWMLRAYEGNRDAQFKVGALFAGDQLNQPNPEQAVYWYTQAARQGHIMAQYNLGHHLLTGNGAEKNEAQAIQWWKEAAKEDHALAQFNVGRAYFLGIGVEEDHSQSRYWFSRAAQNKEAKSIDVLKQLGWDSDLTITSQMINDAPAQVSADNDAESIERSQTSRQQLRESNSSLPQQPISNIPVALYTDPSIRSVLITIVEDRTNLKVLESNDDWIIVSHPNGFPIWVHGDYLQVQSDAVIVDGSNVNARSVPILSTGTVVGKLQGGEKLPIIDSQDGWYRLTSPSSFQAWVKAEDYNRTVTTNTIIGVITDPVAIDSAQNLDNEPSADINEPSADANEPSAANEESEPVPAPVTSVTQVANHPMSLINDNAWLFSQPKDSYTLQLASFDDEQKVNVFLSQSNFGDDAELHRFTATSKDITWTYFLYGNYPNRSDAEATKTRIKQDDAWIRNLGSLQENRCLAWKTKLPTPPELNEYCN